MKNDHKWKDRNKWLCRRQNGKAWTKKPGNRRGNARALAALRRIDTRTKNNIDIIELACLYYMHFGNNYTCDYCFDDQLQDKNFIENNEKAYDSVVRRLRKLREKTGFGRG